MIFFIVKVVVSGILIAVISSMAKTLPKWSSFLMALPMMTFLSLVWIYYETKNFELLETYTRGVLLWTIPTLPFFIAAIYLFRAKISFFATMGLSTIALVMAVWVFEKFHFIK